MFVATMHPIHRFMTPVPASVTLEETVGSAIRLMRRLKVRHLPVLDGRNRVLGVVSDRELQVVSALEGFEPDLTPLELAMIPDPVVVTPETSLKEVAIIMSSSRVGSCVVARGDELLGIFTTTDALEALIRLLPD